MVLEPMVSCPPVTRIFVLIGYSLWRKSGAIRLRYSILLGVSKSVGCTYSLPKRGALQDL